MTNEEAKKAEKELNALLNMCNPSPLTKELEDALKMAIKALEAQPTRVDETYLSVKDAISELKAMREHIVGYMSVVGTTAYDMGIEALEAQPCIEDYPTCTECEHYDKEKHYCPRFCQVIKDALAEAHPSEDCISRQKALDCFEQTNTRQGAKYAIETLPSVTPQRPKGKWIRITNGAMREKYICSECGRQIEEDGIEELIAIKYPYCHCGAEMSGGGEDEANN